MELPVAISGPIEVDVAIRTQIVRWHGDALLESRLRTLVSALIEDLGLPVIPRVKLSGGGEGWVELGPVGMSIEGMICRQEYSPAHRVDPENFDGFLSLVSSVLFANRDLFLSDRVVGALRSAYPAEAIDLLPEIFHRGYTVAAACEIAEQIRLAPEGISMRYQLELSLAERLPCMLEIEVGPRLFEHLIEREESLRNALAAMREKLFYELGVNFPPGWIKRCATLSDDTWRMRYGIIRGPVTATRGQDPQEHMLLELARLLRGATDVFLTVTEAQRSLHYLSEAFPLLIVDLLERYAPAYITEVLRALVREGVSIRDLRSVIEAMLGINGEQPESPRGSVVIAPPVAHLARSLGEHLIPGSPEVCADYVRAAIKRQLTQELMRSGELGVLGTTAETEESLRKMPERMPHSVRRELISSVVRALPKQWDSGSVSLLTATDVRRRLREAISVELPDMAVLCREEVSELGAVITHGSVSWELASA